MSPSINEESLAMYPKYFVRYMKRTLGHLLDIITDIIPARYMNGTGIVIMNITNRCGMEIRIIPAIDSLSMAKFFEYLKG